MYNTLGQQAQAAAEPRATTLESLLDQLSNQIANAQKMFEHSRVIADRFHGGTPTPVEKAGQTVEQGSLLSRFENRIAHLDNVLSSIDAQLGRIDRAL